jgi:hypothetical protein
MTLTVLSFLFACSTPTAPEGVLADMPVEASLEFEGLR